MSKLGFIGLGIMGGPMAAHLIEAGHEVCLSARSKLPAELLSGKAVACASAQEVVEKADIIFMMLPDMPDTPDVAKVLFGDKGASAGLSKGKTVVDMSSISPMDTMDFAKKINDLGCDYLDAPVSGGEVGAKVASLTIMVGGPDAAFATTSSIHQPQETFMTLNRRKVLASSVALGLSASGVQAQTPAWPSKPIRLIVPYPPGGSSDIIGRSISQALSEALKQPVIVENRAGANGNLGADLVAKSAPDGYTLLLCDTGALAISPSVYTKLAFDPSKDLRGVTMLAYSPHLLVVHPSVPANNLKELVALSQKTQLNFAVTAMGSAPHLAGVAVERASGAKWQYIPYKGGSQAVNDTVAGQTQVLMNGMLATLPFVQSGKLKILGVSKATRMPLIGDVPTLQEQGITGFESGTWQGVLVASGTPAPIVARLNAELIKIIRSPEIRARLSGQGAEVVTMSPAEQDKLFNLERKRWAEVVAAANIKLD